MALIHNSHEFNVRVDPLMFEDFDGLDIVPSTELGIFARCRLQELLEFCKRNPKYHIVTIVDGCIYVNKPIENSGPYFLGAGDNDPDLIYSPKKTFEGYDRLKVLEFDTD